MPHLANQICDVLKLLASLKLRNVVCVGVGTDFMVSGMPPTGHPERIQLAFRIGRMIASVGRFRASMYVKTQWIELLQDSSGALHLFR